MWRGNSGPGYADPPRLNLSIIDVIATVEELRVTANVFLVWMVISSPLGMPSWMLDGVFIGATRTRDVWCAMMASLAAFPVVLLALLEMYGNHRLWAAMLLFFLVRCVTLSLRYPALEAEAERSR